MILVQRFARHVLHRDKLNSIGICDVVDMNDIRVIEGGRGFGPAHSGAYDPRRRSSLPQNLTAMNRRGDRLRTLKQVRVRRC
jgi:hypothetical protein